MRYPWLSPGFKKYVRQNITVGVAQTLRVDVALEVGAATESVTVTEQTSLLKTESGELSHTVEAQRLIDLGLLGIGGTFSSSQGLRFYMTEIQLIPGASAPGSGFTFGSAGQRRAQRHAAHHDRRNGRDESD